MTKWLIGSVVILTLLAGLWLQFGGSAKEWITHQRDTLWRETEQAKGEIQTLQEQNAQAREDIATLKGQAQAAEAKAQAWQVEARRAKAQADGFRAEVDRLAQERRALRRIESVQEGFQELRRLGF